MFKPLQRTRPMEEFHMSSVWLNHTEPLTTGRWGFSHEFSVLLQQAAGGFHMSSVWLNHTEPPTTGRWGFSREFSVAQSYRTSYTTGRWGFSHELEVVQSYQTCSNHSTPKRTRPTGEFHKSLGFRMMAVLEDEHNTLTLQL